MLDPSRVSRTRRLRFFVGAITCVFLPAGSLLDGSSTFAWTMYARAGEFRIDFVTFDHAGHAHVRNPTALAAQAGPGAASLLAGSDHWRLGGPMATLRGHLDELAAKDQIRATLVHRSLSRCFICSSA